MSRPMKQSGVEWIGDIPQGWVIYRIKNLANIFTGNSIKDEQKELYEDAMEAIPYISTKDIDATLQTIDFSNGMYIKLSDKSFKRAPAQSTLLCIEGGSAGKKIAYTDREVCFVNKLCCFHSSTCFNKYLYYQLMSSAFTEPFNSHIAGLIGGVSVKTLNNFKILCPPLDEQQRIANFLDDKCGRIDSVISKTRATVAEYKKLKQSIITRAVTKGIRANRSLKYSGIEWLGDIPADWDCTIIGHLFNFIGGYAFSSDKFCGQTNHQVVRMGNIKDDCLILTEKSVFIDDDYAERAKAFIIKPEDILFTMTGTKGKKDYFYTLLVNEKDIQTINLYINQRVGCFRKNEECDMHYYNYLLKISKLKDYIFLFETGTANQGNLGISTIRKTRLPFPPIDEQREIAAYLDEKTSAIDSLVAKKNQLVAELERLKKSLIFEYVTGKKEVAQWTTT